jgi:hypothetical protein
MHRSIRSTNLVTLTELGELAGVDVDGAGDIQAVPGRACVYAAGSCGYHRWAVAMACIGSLHLWYDGFWGGIV